MYFGLVRSKLLYASSVWRPFYQNALYKLEKLNKNGSLVIQSSKFNHDYTEVPDMLQIP